MLFEDTRDFILFKQADEEKRISFFKQADELNLYPRKRMNIILFFVNLDFYKKNSTAYAHRQTHSCVHKFFPV